MIVILPNKTLESNVLANFQLILYFLWNSFTNFIY